MFNVVLSDHSLKFVKKFYKVNVVEITPEQSAQLIVSYQAKRGRPKKLVTGLDMRKAKSVETSQITVKSSNSPKVVEGYKLNINDDRDK